MILSFDTFKNDTFESVCVDAHSHTTRKTGPRIVTMRFVHMIRSGMLYMSKDHMIGVVLFTY